LSLFDHAHDVGFLHDEEVLAVDLDLGARPLAEQDRSPALTSSAWSLPCSSRAPGPTAMISPSMRLFLGGVGDDDAALGLLFLLEALDDDAVMQPGRRPPTWRFAGAPRPA
jgi:hypothetical protein